LKVSDPMSSLATTGGRVRRLVVFAIVVASLLVGNRRAVASCGDYLLHGPMESALHGSGGLARGVGHDSDGLGGHGSLVWDDPAWLLYFPGSDSLPTEPPSPCAGGRCQSAPPPSPMPLPGRIVLWKQLATVLRDSVSDREIESLGWLFPADGVCPSSPSLAVDVPPPECACSHV